MATATLDAVLREILGLELYNRLAAHCADHRDKPVEALRDLVALHLDTFDLIAGEIVPLRELPQ